MILIMNTLVKYIGIDNRSNYCNLNETLLNTIYKLQYRCNIVNVNIKQSTIERDGRLVEKCSTLVLTIDIHY